MRLRDPIGSPPDPTVVTQRENSSPFDRLGRVNGSFHRVQSYSPVDRMTSKRSVSKKRVFSIVIRARMGRARVPTGQTCSRVPEDKQASLCRLDQTHVPCVARESKKGVVSS